VICADRLTMMNLVAVQFGSRVKGVQDVCLVDVCCSINRKQVFSLSVKKIHSNRRMRSSLK